MQCLKLVESMLMVAALFVVMMSLQGCGASSKGPSPPTPVPAQSAFSESAKFERLSHFKDYGVPAVMGKDLVNSAAIADGSCRVACPTCKFDGMFFWHYPDRVERVLTALGSAPKTDQPSHFTLTVKKTLGESACRDAGDKMKPPAYNGTILAKSVQNWYHALCAPEEDPSWNGKFDPAYQPQQMALTVGFMCIAACNSANRLGQLSATAMARLAATADAAQTARDAVCEAFPWDQGIDFSKATDAQTLAHMSAPLFATPCACGSNLVAGPASGVVTNHSTIIFSDSAQFERWSHFKDYGVPAVMGKDPVNSAAIADGSCRLLARHQEDSYFYWHYPDRVNRVLSALAAAPPTDQPSLFTLSVQKALADACSDANPGKLNRTKFSANLAKSAQNWYHALCAPEDDPSWHGKFDPAYQPQQMALTAGFLCIAACDSNPGRSISAASMALLAKTPEVRDSICKEFPWGHTDFSAATDEGTFSKMTRKILTNPCGCVSETTVVSGMQVVSEPTNGFVVV